MFEAKMPDGSPDYPRSSIPAADQAPQLELMLQAIALAERFESLKLHHETKQLPVYALTFVKKGSKIKEAFGRDDPAQGRYFRQESVSTMDPGATSRWHAQRPLDSYVRARSVDAEPGGLSILNLMDRPSGPGSNRSRRNL